MIPFKHAPILLLLFILGCKDSFSPFEEPSLYYALYGMLHTARDTQYVRIFPVRHTLEATYPLPVEAYLQNESTGAHYPLQDTLLEKTWLYYAALTPEPGYAYTLFIVGSPSQKTSATIFIPTQPLINLDIPWRFDRIGRVEYPVQLLLREGILQQILVVYFISRTPEEKPVAVEIAHDPTAIQDARNPQLFYLPIEQDQGEVRARLQVHYQDTLVTFHGIGLSVIVSDPFIRAHQENPARSINVHRGIGYLGARARFDTTWQLPAEVIDSLNYRNVMIQ